MGGTSRCARGRTSAKATAWLALALCATAARGAPLGVEALPAPSGRPRILLAVRAGPSATLRLSFAAGSADDGESPGLAHLAQHALVSANARLDEEDFHRALWGAGASLQLEVGQRETTFTLSAPRRDLVPLARRLLPALLAPRLTAARLPVAAARAVLDLGSEDGGLLGLLAGLAARDRRQASPPAGARAVLESLDLPDVLAFVERHFTPGNATVVVAGAFERAEVVALLAGWRGGQRAPIGRLDLELPTSRRLVGQRELHLLAHPVRLESARDVAAVRVASQLLEGALWRDFREAGFGYSFQVEVLRSDWLDALAIVLPAHDAGGGDDLGPRLRAAVAGLRDGTFAPAELERGRSAALAALEREDRTPEALAQALASGGTRWHGPEVAAALRALDREGLLTAIRGWLDPASSVYLYLGTAP
jgi:predicted Zn-dependent peptidase